MSLRVTDSEHPEAVGDEARGPEEEQVVDVAEERAELPGRRLRAGGLRDPVDGGGGHQSDSWIVAE